MAFGEALQGFQRTDDEQEVGIGVELLAVGGHLPHHEVAHAAAVEFGNVVVAVAQLGADGEKE